MRLRTGVISGQRKEASDRNSLNDIIFRNAFEKQSTVQMNQTHFLHLVATGDRAK